MVALLVGLAGSSGAESSDEAVAGASAVRLHAPPKRLTFGFVGDVHTLRAVNGSALQPDGSFDYAPLFAEVAPQLSWFDTSMCHMEAPIAPPGTEVIVEAPQLSAAPSIAPALAGAGFDRCSTASNHSLDRGAAGIDATLNAFDAAGLGHSGTARSAAEAQSVTFEVRGVEVAHLSYSFSFSGIPLPAGQPWRANMIDTTAIVAAARAARAAGAQVVVLSLHWGVDAQSAVTSYQRAVAEAVTASGQIDLIVGHHAHVLQPISQVNGVWVIWGLGNFVSDLPTREFWPASSQDSVIAGVEMMVHADGRVEVRPPTVYPIWCDKQHGHVARLTSTADDTSIALSSTIRSAMRQSEARTRALLGPFFAVDA
ncbi:MAG: CapA family protein [Actinomycetota bacterium]|nr:CapA family protein [Actinomycetota bacterium]